MVDPGDRVGSLMVERELGGGAFATVYVVVHEVLRSRHALKLLNPDLGSQPRLHDRFLAEGRILAQLSHPNLVRVTDVIDVPPDRVGLLMDFVDGEPLDAVIARTGGPVSREHTMAIMRGLLDGLHHAHERGIVHRDIKPENIIIARTDDSIRPVLIDFGIAKVLDGTQVDTGPIRRTRMKAQLGTPAYMSPEQIEANHAVDRRADIFSLGTVLFELLTGQQAFQGSGQTEIMYKVTRGDLVIPPDLPADLREVLRKALAVDPADRYPNCEAFWSELAAAAEAPAMSGVPSAPGPAAHPPRRRTALDTPMEAPMPEKPRNRWLITAAILFVGAPCVLIPSAGAVWMLLGTPGLDTVAPGASDSFDAPTGSVATPALDPPAASDDEPTNQDDASDADGADDATADGADDATADGADDATADGADGTEPGPPDATDGSPDDEDPAPAEEDDKDAPSVTPSPAPAPTPAPPRPPSDRELVQGELSKLQRTLRRCHSDHGSGRVAWKLDLRVGTNGRVLNASFASASSQPSAYTSCLEDAVRNTRFPRLQSSWGSIETIRLP